MTEFSIDESGRVSVSGTVVGDTIDAVHLYVATRCKAFFAHHAFEITQIDARPIETVGGDVVTWTADFEARMVPRAETA